MSSHKKKNEVANNRPNLHRDLKSTDLNKDYISTTLKNENWERNLGVNLNNANTSAELLLDSVNEEFNYEYPLKIISNSEEKNQSKPWITQGILKSIAVNYRLHRKLCKMKDKIRNTELEKNLIIIKTTLL